MHDSNSTGGGKGYYEAESSAVSSPFLKKQSVDLSFRNITFEIKTRKWRKPFHPERKEILHGVSGELNAGELTAIMGPSGAGKSTLLNILAGYTLRGAQGSIYVNGHERSKTDPQSFKRLSCYIQQDNHLRGELTVLEAMTIASELKLGSSVSAKDKQIQIRELLEMLGLYSCLKTETSRLSGGQQKRLSIAFELITNPPVIFLDEPTTGLDSSSCSQCVSTLKQLANQGRTIVCTIHTPSALIFEMFDKVYALADGYCIYDGPTKELVPFLSEKGLKCPVYHNPADFLLEVAIGEYGPVIDKLAAKSKNLDQYVYKESSSKKSGSSFQLKDISIKQIKQNIKKHTSKDSNSNIKVKKDDGADSLTYRLSQLWPSNFISEFYHLYSRNIMIFQKAYKYRLTTFLAHIFSSALIGVTFFGTGNEASMVRSNLAALFGVLIFLVYMGKMAVMLIIPNEIRILRVEHFNRWYSLLPFYLSMIIIEIPMQMFNCIVGVPILYYLSDQPMEWFRYAYFLLFCIVTSLAAQAIGFFLGATVPVKIAVFVGPVGAATISIFGFTLRYCDTPFIFQWISLLSYFRSAFQSVATLLYGYDRGFLECKHDLYCHFRSPKKLLDEMDMSDIDIYANLIYICSIGFFMHVLTFLVLYVKLNKR